VVLCVVFHYVMGASAAVTAGSLESHSNVSSSTVTTSKEHARVACGHILVINRVTHPLITKAVRQVRTQLEASGLAQKWEFIESSQPKVQRPRRSDLFIVIDSAEIGQKGLFSRSIEVALHARLGTDPYLSTHSSSTRSNLSCSNRNQALLERRSSQPT